MSFATRIAEYPKENDRIGSVWSWVYGQEPLTEPLDPPDPGEIWFLGEEDGEPATACTVHDYRAVRGPVDLSCGGVGAVATLIEYRQKGYGTKFMLDLLPVMREAGHVVSSLYAFRDPFYAKSGYATSGWRWKISCQSHRLPKTECTLPVAQVESSKVACLDGCYEKFIRTFSGSVVRREHEWKRRLGKKHPMIYAVGDPIEAYAWVKMTEFWGNVDVGEVGWSTTRGYESILAVLRGIAHNQATLTWSEPPHSPFLAGHFDQGVDFQLARQTMHRVLDVKKAVEALKPAGKGQLDFKVTDPQMKENDGCWRAEWSEGKVSVQKTKSSEIDFEIGPFSQAFMGAPSVRELAQHGSIKATKEDALQRAERLLSPMPVCCMEFF
ncbi:MAG TPA: GNAT family N-acetyltransferase [Fimbriimonadaceae bacterium]|nr:GNAT family N-acetyltransferase [Fimbriimonadaceae bacterium]